jgi:hypothetical protein
MFIQSKTNWKFLAIIAALAILVGGGIFWWQKSVPEPEIIVLQQNNLEAASSSIPGVADWQTYRNEEYGIEFNYPSNWAIGEYPFSSGGTTIALDPESVISEETFWTMDMMPGLISIRLTQDSFMEKQTTNAYIGINNQINAQKTERFTSEENVPNPWYFNRHILSYTIYGYGETSSIYIDYVSDLNSDEYLADFNQILSTFKFIK